MWLLPFLVDCIVGYLAGSVVVQLRAMLPTRSTGRAVSLGFTTIYVCEYYVLKLNFEIDKLLSSHTRHGHFY